MKLTIINVGVDINESKTIMPVCIMFDHEYLLGLRTKHINLYIFSYLFLSKSKKWLVMEYYRELLNNL